MSKSLSSKKALTYQTRRALRWQFCGACKGVGNEVYQDAAEKQAGAPSFTHLSLHCRKKDGHHLRSDGQLYSQKDAKNSGQSAFLSAREIEHGRFRALFAGWFWPKMSQHSAVSNQHSAKTKTNIKSVLLQRTRSPGRKTEPYAHVSAWAVSAPDDCAKPTPIWDDLGCGGIPREGEGVPEIADIARNRRDRKIKTLPLMNTDDTDQESGGWEPARLLAAGKRM